MTILKRSHVDRDKHRSTVMKFDEILPLSDFLLSFFSRRMLIQGRVDATLKTQKSEKTYLLGTEHLSFLVS